MTTLVCLILDVGAHMYTDIESAVDCLKLLVQRDFFAQKKHEVALVLCGVESPSNVVTAIGNEHPPNIALIRELAPLDWDILEFLNKETLLSPHEASVIDAISVAVRHLVEESKTRKKVEEKRIILLSNLSGPSEGCVSDIAEACNAAEIQLSLIGVRLEDSRHSPDEGPGLTDAPGPSRARTSIPNARNKLQPALSSIAELWVKQNGESYLFSEALPSLSLFEGRTIAQRGWKVDFRIGNDFSFPIEGFTQVQEAVPPSLKHLCASDPSIPIRPVTTYHAEKSDEEVERSQVIRGYRYGNTLVPFSDEDQKSVKRPSEKCLDLIGFTSSCNVPRNLYVGNSVLVFVGCSAVEGSESVDPATAALTALAQALFELDSVALVRRVYNRISAPRLGVLTPRIREHRLVLIYTDLAFAEDVRQFDFPSLPVTDREEIGLQTSSTSSLPNTAMRFPSPSTEQLVAMDRYIDAMMLGNDGRRHSSEMGAGDQADDSESEDDEDSEDRGVDLKPERVPNPWIQRLFSCFRQRGLSPSEPLIPSTSQRDPFLSNTCLLPSNFPGLERLIARLIAEPQLGGSSVLEARQALLTTLPSLSSTDKPSEEEPEGVAAKRRRLMARELFGLDIDSGESTQTANELKNTLSAVTDASEVDTLVSGDISTKFERLISQRQFDAAGIFMGRCISNLVTNPLTPQVLRSRAFSALMIYRHRAVALGQNGNMELAEAYNAFLMDWKRRAMGSNSEGSEESAAVTSELEPRRTFWRETINQGFGLITEEEVPGFESSQGFADEMAVCPWEAGDEQTNGNKFDITSSRKLVVKDLLDDIE